MKCHVAIWGAMQKHWSSTSAACVSFKCWKHKPCTICHHMQSIGRGWVVQQETYQIRSPPLQVQYTRRYVSVPICVGAESPSHPSHTWEPCVLRELQCVRQYVLHGRMRGGQARPRPAKIPYALATGCLLVCRYVSGLSPLATPVTPGSRACRGRCSVRAGMYCTGACEGARQGRDRQRSPTLWPLGAFWCADMCRG